MSDLQQIAGVGPARAAALEEHGYNLETLGQADPSDIADLLGVSGATAVAMVAEALARSSVEASTPFTAVDHLPVEAGSHDTAVYEYFLTGRVKQ